MQQSRGQKLLYFVVFLVLVGFLTFAVMSSRDTKKPTSVVKAPVKTQNVGSSSSEVSQQPSGSGTQPSQAAAGVNNAQLATTGPTETVALFVLTAAGGTVAAHLFQRRRSGSSNI